jgi:hypothetical protein
VTRAVLFVPLFPSAGLPPAQPGDKVPFVGGPLDGADWPFPVPVPSDPHDAGRYFYATRYGRRAGRPFVRLVLLYRQTGAHVAR